MIEIMGQVGTVQSILEGGDLRIRYPNDRVFTIHGWAVSKVNGFSEGDVVKVIDDMSMVHDLQDDHGGWIDDMALVMRGPLLI
jgi:hypothetical protein